MAARFQISCIVLCTATAFFLSGCKEEKSATPGTESAPTAALVAVVQVKPETVTIADELPGRVAAFRTAEIRAQVGGIIERRLFDQGAEVVAGQVLFQINPAPFKAEVESAAAVLQRVQAGVIRSQAKFDRARELVSTKAISKEAYDDAVADLAQAKANVAEAKATLQRRQLDLEFATVRAPIAGQIGSALVSEGALVAASATTALATIQQIDQVYVDVRQPASQFEVIREAVKSGQLAAAAEVPVAILAASGKPYPITGRALFYDISVDPGTGNATVRVVVPNPDDLLLPGMYVRTRLPRGVVRDALMVPQEAIVRDPTGRPQVVIVDDKKTASHRNVEIGDIVEGRYVVRSGLKPDETVVVRGQERVQDGATVETVAFDPNTAQAQQ